MAGIADLVKQKEQEQSGPSISDLVRQRELTHQNSFTAMMPDQKLATQYGPLAEPGLPDAGLRADLSLSRDFGDKLAKFANKYPYGELSQDPESGTILFRKTPSDQWAKLDAPMFEKLELGDIADLTGDLPAIAGEVLLTKGAGSLKSLAARAFAGAAGGDIARSLSEKGRGYEAPGMFPSAGMEGGLALAGEGGGALVRKGVNAVRGAGAMEPDPFIRQIMREGEKRGVPQLHPGQASENPIVQAFARQSRALSGKIHEYERKQEGAALDLLEGLRERGDVYPLPRQLETALKQRENDLSRRLVMTPVNQTDAGKALKQGIEEYRDMSGRAVTHAYEEARAVGEPGFDISDIQIKAEEIGRGVQAPMAGGKTARVSELNPELQKVIEEVRALDPQRMGDARSAVESGADAPFDVLKDLRSRLFDLKTPSDGVYRQEHRLANELYKELTETIKNPVGGGENFLEKWTKANNLASDRFSTLEQPTIAKALRMGDGGDVEALYRSVFRPNNANQIQFVKKVLPKARYDELKAGAVTDLLSDPYKMFDRLRQFDDATLKEVFTGPETEALKDVGYQFKRLEQTGIRRALERQSQANATVRDIIEAADTAGSDTLFEMSGGRDTEMGRRIRAGIMEWVHDQAIERTKTGRRVNRTAIMNAMDRLKKTGMLKFLSPTDKRVLHTFLPDYISVIRGVKTDTGESIRRATIVQKLTDNTASALLDIMEEVGIGRLMTTAGGQKWVYGFRGKPWDMNSMRRLSASLAILANDYESEQAGVQ